MKKRITLALLAAAVLLLAACAGKTEPTAPTAAAPTVTEEPTQQTVETPVTEAETPEAGEVFEPEYPGVYWRTWSEEIGGTVVEMNSYIVLNEDHTGYWIAQGVGALNWDESQLMLTIGAVYDIAMTQDGDTLNLLVYESQDADGVWIPTVFEKIDALPAEMEAMLEEA